VDPPTVAGSAGVMVDAWTPTPVGSNPAAAVDNDHAATIALYFMYYNFARIHQTLRVTPAMEAGIAQHVWSIEEIVGLLG
jgi:hypothetical protein